MSGNLNVLQRLMILQLQYHLYSPLAPHRDNLLAYQRTSHDFFIPDELRREFQRRNEATLQVLPSKSTRYPFITKLDL